MSLCQEKCSQKYVPNCSETEKWDRAVRERSNIIWRLGRGFAQTVRVPSCEGWLNCHITLIVAKKLNLQLILLYLRYMWEEGVGWKRHMGGRGWLKTSEYRHIGERGLKLLKKPSYDIWTFPSSAKLTNKMYCEGGLLKLRCQAKCLHESKWLLECYFIVPRSLLRVRDWVKLKKCFNFFREKSSWYMQCAFHSRKHY